MKVALSYILTTFNKLPYLSITLPLLIAACGKDEEIVVVDGGSTDGTVEYLKTLVGKKQVHTLISEKDHGESHGTNKAILASKGELIKIITDDDVFDYELIRKCRNFMEQNPSADMLGFDGLACNIADEKKYIKSNYITGFKLWLSDKTPFIFCGLSFLFRRSSISYMGLLSTEYKIIDMEYSIRVSALKTNICYCTGFGFVNIVNPDSNSQKFYSVIRDEQKKLLKIYPSIKNNFLINNPWIRLKDKLKGLRNITDKVTKSHSGDYGKIVMNSVEELKQLNLGKKPVFLGN